MLRPKIQPPAPFSRLGQLCVVFYSFLLISHFRRRQETFVRRLRLWLCAWWTESFSNRLGHSRLTGDMADRRFKSCHLCPQRQHCRIWTGRQRLCFPASVQCLQHTRRCGYQHDARGCHSNYGPTPAHRQLHHHKGFHDLSRFVPIFTLESVLASQQGSL